jgi:restriction endonuclease S subunit
MSESVPEGWEIRTSELIFERLKVQKVYDRNNVLNTGKFPVIDQSDNGEIGFLDTEPEFLCHRDDPIVTFANHTCAVRRMTIPFGVIQNVFPLSNRSDTDINFIFQILKGGVEPEGYKGHYPKMRETEFLLPPLPEQKKIASILTSVDEVIEKTQSQIDKLKDLKKATMNELLTKGIGHTEFKDSALGRIPKSWEVEQLPNCLEKIVDCEHKTAPKVEHSDFFVVSTNAVKDAQLINSELYKTSGSAFKEWTSRAVPQEGDVMFTREAPAGESCCVPENINVCLGQRMVLLRTKKEIMESRFLNYFLNSYVGQNNIYRLSLGTTVSRINMEDIRKLLIPVPSSDEQKTIADIILSYDRMINYKEVNHRKLQSLKKSLMQDLLTGKVRVSIE